MASVLVQWVGVSGRAPKEMSGQERASHAAHIVSVLDRTGTAGKVEELRRIAVQGGFLSAPLRYAIRESAMKRDLLYVKIDQCVNLKTCTFSYLRFV
jgi:hypothetical protein